MKSILRSPLFGVVAGLALATALVFEIDSKGEDKPKDVEEVVNYVGGMNYGLQRLKEFPLSLRLIREIHGKLLQESFVALGLLEEMTGWQRNRRYRFKPYLALFESP